MCQRCGVHVHQFCYGLQRFPFGNSNWLCKVCELGAFNANKEECVICLQRGGAFKRTKGNISWCHVACALWLPEVLIENPAEIEGIDVSGVNPQRRKLRCIICKGATKGGACIQCVTKQCTQAFHPPCMLHKTKEIFHQVRFIPSHSTDEDGCVVYEAHCPGKHAKWAFVPSANPGEPPRGLYKPRTSNSKEPSKKGKPATSKTVPASAFSLWESGFYAVGLTTTALEIWNAQKTPTIFDALARQLLVKQKFYPAFMEAHLSSLVFSSTIGSMALTLKKCLAELSERNWKDCFAQVATILCSSSSDAFILSPDLLAQVPPIASGEMSGPEFFEALKNKQQPGCSLALRALCRFFKSTCSAGSRSNG